MDTQDQTVDPQTPTDIVGDTAAIGKKHLAKNTLSSAVFVVFNAVSSIIMLPFVLHRLGDAYAMIYIANSFVGCLAVLSGAVTSSTGRFIGLEVSRGDREAARDYLGTQWTAAWWMTLALLPITLALAILAPHYVRHIPQGHQIDTQILFALVFLSFLISLIASPLRVATMVTQRFDLSNAAEIANQLMRYSTWVMLFLIIAPRLWQIGLGYTLGTAVQLLALVVIFHYLTPWLWPKLGSFNRQKFIESAKMGGWMSVAQVGMALYVALDGIIIQNHIGSAACTRYGAIAFAIGQVRVMSGQFMLIVAMPLISCCASGEWQRLMLNTARAVKYLALVLALLLGIFCGLSRPIVICWLGPQYAGLSILIWLMTSHLVINIGMDPTSSAAFAANRMCPLAIATVAGGALKLGLALVLIRHTTWGIYSLIAADIVAMTLKNQIFAPIYMARITKSSCLLIYKALVPPVLVFGVTSGVCYIVSGLIDFGGLNRITGIALLLVMAAGLLAVFAAGAYLLALNKSDREFFRQASPWKRKSTEAAGA